MFICKDVLYTKIGMTQHGTKNTTWNQWPSEGIWQGCRWGWLYPCWFVSFMRFSNRRIQLLCLRWKNGVRLTSVYQKTIWIRYQNYMPIVIRSCIIRGLSKFWKLSAGFDEVYIHHCQSGPFKGMAVEIFLVLPIMQDIHCITYLEDSPGR